MNGPLLQLDQMAAMMALVSNPVRLSLLDQLRYPRTLAELTARSSSKYGDARAERSMSREAIRQHIAKLVDGGLVRAIPGKQKQYIVDRPRTYALAQQLLQLSSQFETEALEPGATMAWSAPDAPKATAGPQLVLVHGAYEGRSFPLSKGEQWSIGRAEDQDVALDYDPFVSRQHASIVRAGGHVLHDLATNPHRVRVNGVRLDVGGQHALVHGDIISLGRSVLVFQDR